MAKNGKIAPANTPATPFAPTKAEKAKKAGKPDKSPMTEAEKRAAAEAQRLFQRRTAKGQAHLLTYIVKLLSKRDWAHNQVDMAPVVGFFEATAAALLARPVNRGPAARPLQVGDIIQLKKDFSSFFSGRGRVESNDGATLTFVALASGTLMSVPTKCAKLAEDEPAPADAPAALDIPAATA